MQTKEMIELLKFKKKEAYHHFLEQIELIDEERQRRFREEWDKYIKVSEELQDEINRIADAR